jgi:hypothetical protein
MTSRIALSPGRKVRAGRCRSTPAVPARVRHASEAFAVFQTSEESTAIKPMARHQKPGTARIDLDISPEAKLRFASIHESLGFKTKAETFDAILYFVATKDKIDPAIMERIEAKLDHALETLESLT